jgi:hypothetical protein
VLLLAGCGRKPGEVMYPVKGRITLDGKPLPRGSVSLRPASGLPGHQPTGVIEPAGEYTIYTNGRQGAPPGGYKVVVFATEATTSPDGTARPGLPKSLIPIRYNQPDQSSLRLDVVAQPVSGAYDLDLSSNE